MPLLLAGIATLVFIVSRLTPADPLVSIVGERNLTNPEVVAAAKARWGLDKSVVSQYFTYMKNLLHGDMGTSFSTRRPVLSDLWDRLPATLELTFAAMAIGLVFGVGLGVLAARHRNGWIDHIARFFALLGSSLPAFWAGLLALYVFYAQLGILPGPGRLDPRASEPGKITGFFTIDSLLHGDMSTFWSALKHLILPACVLGWGAMCSFVPCGGRAPRCPSRRWSSCSQ